MVFKILKEFKKTGDITSAYKKMVMNNKDSNGFLIYNGF